MKPLGLLLMFCSACFLLASASPFPDLMLFPPQDMIHIADTKVARRYGDFFIRQIHKFEEVRSGQESCVVL